MSEAGGRLIAGAKEALAVARGEEPAASITVNGHRYVPAAEITRLQKELETAREALRPFADIAGEAWADENGWTAAACPNDRIHNWFGPSAFLAARRATKGGRE